MAGGQAKILSDANVRRLLQVAKADLKRCEPWLVLRA